MFQVNQNDGGAYYDLKNDCKGLEQIKSEYIRTGNKTNYNMQLAKWRNGMQKKYGVFDVENACKLAPVGGSGNIGRLAELVVQKESNHEMPKSDRNTMGGGKYKSLYGSFMNTVDYTPNVKSGTFSGAQIDRQTLVGKSVDYTPNVRTGTYGGMTGGAKKLYPTFVTYNTPLDGGTKKLYPTFVTYNTPLDGGMGLGTQHQTLQYMNQPKSNPLAYVEPTINTMGGLGDQYAFQQFMNQPKSNPLAYVEPTINNMGGLGGLQSFKNVKQMRNTLGNEEKKMDLLERVNLSRAHQGTVEHMQQIQTGGSCYYCDYLMR